MPARWGLFQFHSGSIKRIVRRLRDAGDFGFNSIVVRLKGARPSHFPRFDFMFQFHSGSIKRIFVLGRSAPKSPVSIP